MEEIEGSQPLVVEEKYKDENIVYEGDTVIVKMHDELDTMIKINSTVEQKIGKIRVDVTPIIGCSYGTIFEIRGRKLIKVDGNNMSQNEGERNICTPSLHPTEFGMFTNTSTGDNRSFTDTNTAQKLTDVEIHQLRDQGASAKEIISSLITNSETWNNKTEFSQEKWLMRKQKK